LISQDIIDDKWLKYQFMVIKSKDSSIG